jgi:hypothetical protein
MFITLFLQTLQHHPGVVNLTFLEKQGMGNVYSAKIGLAGVNMDFDKKTDAAIRIIYALEMEQAPLHWTISKNGFVKHSGRGITHELKQLCY